MTTRRTSRTAVLSVLIVALAAAAGRAQDTRVAPPAVTLVTPARVWDGSNAAPHEAWAVLVRGERIEAVGPRAQINAPADAKVIDLPGTTLIPGMIEAHSHLLLHPYNEAAWDDQVLREPEALRVARATNHARNTLMAGFTTVRDLGTEGAGYADVGLKMAIAQGIIPGPRMIVTTKAIIATGSYAPKAFSTDYIDVIPQARSACRDLSALGRTYSHSMVAGGFELTSYTTRFTPSTSLMIRVDIRASTSCGNGNQSAVIPSVLVTARRATTLS